MIITLFLEVGATTRARGGSLTCDTAVPAQDAAPAQFLGSQPKKIKNGFSSGSGNSNARGKTIKINKNSDANNNTLAVAVQ